jgi:hypothetical protein
MRQGTLTVALLLLAAPDIRAAVERGGQTARRDRGGLVEGVIAKRPGIARDQVAVGVVKKNRRCRHRQGIVSSDIRGPSEPDKT